MAFFSNTEKIIKQWCFTSQSSALLESSGISEETINPTNPYFLNIGQNRIQGTNIYRFFWSFYEPALDSAFCCEPNVNDLPSELEEESAFIFFPAIFPWAEGGESVNM